MDNSWDNFEPAPLEFFHGRLLHHFHEYREKEGGGNRWVPVSGTDLNNIIAKSKTDTYAKYPKHVSNKAIPKSEM